MRSHFILEWLQKELRKPRAAFILIAILAVLIISQLGSFMTITVLQNPPDKPKFNAQKTVEKIDIPKWHLFGSYADQAGSLPITQLNLKLLGILYSSDPLQSQALMSGSGLPVKVYKAGDSLISGVKIKQILSNSIILEQNGELSRLPLPQSELNFLPPPNGF